MVKSRAIKILCILTENFSIPQWAGSRRDAFQALIRTVISQATASRNTTRAFENLSKRFPITPQALAEAEEKEILFGDIELLPLPAGEKASLEIRPERHFDIGLGQPGRGAVAQVEGGLLGVIIDARGRPLRLPGDDLERQQQLQQWLNALGVNYATPVDYD